MNKRDLIAKEGKNAPGCHPLTRQICQTIRLENQHNQMLDTAETQGWPMKINFSEIPERVLAHQDAIVELTSDSTELEICATWLSFLDSIKYKVYAFSCASPGSFSNAAEHEKRCG